jgi:hypothetical protein
LLEQSGDSDAELVEALRPYLESAHLDARRYFHEAMGINLHPDAEGEGAHAQYPMCLPSVALLGIFGELMAGLITESYSYVGEHEWKVPIYLFRFHADVEAYLFKLARDPEYHRQTFGRFGDDFIGVSLNEDGSLARTVLGEAKWRQSLTAGTVETLLKGQWVENDEGERVRDGKGIWSEINSTQNVTHGLRQLQRVLMEYGAEEYSGVVTSLSEMLMLANEAPPLERTDLILLIGNNPARRAEGEATVGWEDIPEEYTAGNDLQIVEIYLKEGETFINELYQSLWMHEADNAG